MNTKYNSRTVVLLDQGTLETGSNWMALFIVVGATASNIVGSQNILGIYKIKFIWTNTGFVLDM